MAGHAGGRQDRAIVGRQPALRLHRPGPFDLIYVDGSHAEPWVARDTENAFALLAPTGAILWDDCFWHDVLSVLGRSGRHQPIYLFEDGSTAGYLQIDGKAVSVS